MKSTERKISLEEVYTRGFTDGISVAVNEFTNDIKHLINFDDIKEKAVKFLLEKHHLGKIK